MESSSSSSTSIALGSTGGGILNLELATSLISEIALASPGLIDLLFAIVNLSRYLTISSEDALRKTNQKFIRRFKKVEEGIKAKGKKLDEASLEEMDYLWNEAKHNE